MAKFGVGLPEAIDLPHSLPSTDGHGTDKTYHDSADNIVAAYKAGRAAIVRDLSYVEAELRCGIRTYDAPAEGERAHHKLALGARRALAELDRLTK